MFDNLSNRLSAVLKKFSGQAHLSEDVVQDGLREVRMALLEADVNFKVVKDFTERLKERCLGLAVEEGLNPAQQVIKVVNEELTTLLGGETTELQLDGDGPHVIMMVGLQGAGKTTSTAKIAHYLRGQNFTPYLVPADVYRPAAIDQLVTLAKQLNMPYFASTTDMTPVAIAQQALVAAAEAGCDVILIDTAGRLHIDAVLMAELHAIKDATKPKEILFVADAMTGQDAVTVAAAFNELLDLSGIVLTKMDGDARGGAALSIKSVMGKSVKFVGMGEKISELEVFHPDRIAGRILGMGDMLTLIEKAQGSIDAAEAEELNRKLEKAEFDLEDFRTQMRRIKKLGSLGGLLKMIPGMGSLTDKLGDLSGTEKETARLEAMINSMTLEERRNPKIISTSRRRRIAKGSGSSIAQLGQMLKQFEGMRKMMQGIMSKEGKAAASASMAGNPAVAGLPGMDGMPAGSFPGMPGMGAGAGAAGTMSKAALQKKREQRKKQKKHRKKQR